MNFSDLEIGGIILFINGKKGRPISYTDSGKVILCQHSIQLGWAVVKSMVDKGNYYSVTAEHIIHDLYRDIDYEEFMRVMDKRGFKIGFDETFTRRSEVSPISEHYIYAYNKSNLICINAVTFTDKGKKSGFNTIHIYLPHVGAFRLVNYDRMFYHGGHNMSVLDSCHLPSTSHVMPLNHAEDLINQYGCPSADFWPEDELPSFYTYNDDLGANSKEDYQRIEKKYLDMCDFDALSMFRGKEIDEYRKERRMDHV